MPLPIVVGMAQLLDVIEATGQWPNEMVHAWVIILPKSEDESPDTLDQRPITVMSALYRAWSSYRFADAQEWLSERLGPELRGGRAGGMCEDIVAAVALRHERAAIEGRDAYSILVDRKTCFDLIDRRVAWPLLRRCGVDERVVRPLEALYGRLRRRFVFSRSLGPWWEAFNGLAQGCALTILVLNLFMEVNVRSVLAAAPAGIAHVYLDDLTMEGEDEETARKQLRTQEVFDEVAGMAINAKKTECIANSRRLSEALRALRVGGGEIGVVGGAKLLGCVVTAAGQPQTTAVVGRRVSDAVAVARRIRAAPLYAAGRATLLATAAASKVRHGLWLTGLRRAEIDWPSKPPFGSGPLRGAIGRSP